MTDLDMMMNPQDALVAVMVAVSASDENLRTSELVAIQRIVNHLPAFGGYDSERLRGVTNRVLDLFADEDGLDEFFALLRDSLPERLYETAYALACDVAAADGALYEMELQFLQAIRDELAIDRLHAAAIERGARARHLPV
ncbi:MAG: tellurite resistance TerB family protein [Pseudorhodobacter sp.]